MTQGRAYRLAFSPDGAKALVRMQASVARRILGAMKVIAADPFGQHPAAKALAGGRGMFRLRVGDWRALYRVERTAKRVYVEDVVKREDAYR